MLVAILDGERAGDRRHSSVRFDSQLAQHFDSAPAAIERVWPEVQVKAVLLLCLRASSKRVRLFKKDHALPALRQNARGRKPCNPAADNDYIVSIIPSAHVYLTFQ